MNQRLSESRIRATCRELLSKQGRVSGRRVCAELRTRFGAVGKTERVFAIWREESAVKGRAEMAPATGVNVAVEIAELERRLAAAEAAAAENLKRAERAELRERAHQERWAAEVDRLRQDARGRPDQAATIRTLQDQVLKLSQELVVERGGGGISTSRSGPA
jgi:hypothetical protein